MKKTEGVTLIELMVAMVVIAITVVGTLEFFVFCQKFFISPARPKIMAANFARETMEDYAWRSAAVLPDQVNTPISSLPNSEYFDEFADKYPPAARTVTVSTNSDNGYKIITVAVNWTR